MTGSRRALVFAALGLLVPGAALLAVSAGSVYLPVAAVLSSLAVHAGLPSFASLEPSGELILWTVRLPRVILAFLVGGGLAVVGATLQAVFRNPMADAGLLGVGPGAALGAVIAVQLGWASQVFLALPASAFVGALLSLFAVYGLAHATGRASLQGLLLTGLAISAFAAAAISALLAATEEFRVKAVLFWLAGGLEGRGWPHVKLAAGVIVGGAVLLTLLARPLDLLAVGEEEAAALGLRVHVTRLAILTLASLVGGAATATAGSIPFVGLVAAHALRPLVGPLGRHLLPASFLAGGLLVVLADVASRTLGGRIDLPLGSLTAFLGAPYFLIALRGSEDRT